MPRAKAITTIPVKLGNEPPIGWKDLVKHSGATPGARQVWGIAYNGANPGQRKRVTCSDEVWNNPDNRIFYADESVCLTVDELKALDLAGVPMRVQHDTDLPPVGVILGNWVDKQGRLWIHGEVPNESRYHESMIQLIDSGRCSDLSISYGVERNPETGEVYHDKVDEISFVTEGHFRGCRVGVKASNSTFDKVPAPRREFRFVIASSTSSSLTNTTTTTTSTMSAPTNNASQSAAAAAPAAAPSLDDLMNQNTKSAKERLAAMKELEETKKALDAVTKELNERREQEAKKKKEEEDAIAAAKQKYREEHLDEAKEVVEFMVNELLESGIELSEGWKKVNTDILTETEPIARQTAAVQVSCAKKIKCQAQTIAELQATVEKLKSNMQMTEMMNRVAEADGEADRYDERRKRPVNAAAQQKSRQLEEQAAPAPPRKVADWCLGMMSPGYQLPQEPAWNPRPSQQPQQQQRPVNAGAQQPQKNGARIGNRKATAQQEEEQDETGTDEQQQSRKKVSAGGSTQFVPRPLREGYPVNPHSFRNSQASQPFWQHMVNVWDNTLSFEKSGLHHANFDFTRPQ